MVRSRKPNQLIAEVHTKHPRFVEAVVGDLRTSLAHRMEHRETKSGLDTVVQVLHEEPVRPGRLRPDLPRDLETICLKCLEKDPRRRYDSAEALAEDLRRFRHGKPIQARPVGLAERAAKLARRHPLPTALLIGITLVTVLGFVGVTSSA